MAKRTKGDELNVKELRVMKVTTAEPVTIAQIARKAWPGKGWTSGAKGNSHVRNCLRKLIKLKKFKQVGRGLYQKTAE